MSLSPPPLKCVRSWLACGIFPTSTPQPCCNTTLENLKVKFGTNYERQSLKCIVFDRKMKCFSLYVWMFMLSRHRVRAKSPIFDLFARSDSAVTPIIKTSINTNRKSTTHFPMSPRWTLYVVPKPHRVAQKRKVSKIWTISCDNSEMVRDRVSVSVTINH